MIIKKIPMSVATMSWKTKRAYLGLCAEKRRKNSGSKGLKISQWYMHAVMR